MDSIAYQEGYNCALTRYKSEAERDLYRPSNYASGTKEDIEYNLGYDAGYKALYLYYNSLGYDGIPENESYVYVKD